MNRNEKEQERTKKINREILHFTFTILLSALTAIAIVSLAIK